MQAAATGPQVYIALILAATAAVMTMPHDPGARYRAAGWYMLQSMALQAVVETGTPEDPLEQFVSP